MQVKDSMALQFNSDNLCDPGSGTRIGKQVFMLTTFCRGLQHMFVIVTIIIIVIVTIITRKF